MSPDPISSYSSLRQRAHLPYPTLAWVCRHPARFIAFGLGSGLIRPASGTWGTLCAWLVWIVLAPVASDGLLGIFIALAFACGCWACQHVERELQVHDHIGVVWDELVAFWLVLWLTPHSFFAQSCAFVLFRFFDIIKPQPIKYFDARLKGGIGVMWDDILAAGYTLLIMALMVRIGVFK
jgi:phosphatidylglycerophosphatase A